MRHAKEQRTFDQSLFARKYPVLANFLGVCTLGTLGVGGGAGGSYVLMGNGWSGKGFSSLHRRVCWGGRGSDSLLVDTITVDMIPTTGGGQSCP